METAQILIMVVIVVYLALMIVIGAIYSKQTKNVGDFYLGGRRLGPLVTAMSAEASDMSSWLLMGLPGVAYLSGICDAGWTAIGLALGTYLNWLIVAKRLRNYSACNNSITIPDFFSNRYREKKNLLMIFSAIIIIVFFVPYTASGFAACGKLFSTLFGIDYHVAMVASAVVIVGYTMLGGFNAASTTDFIQSIVMTVALVIVLAFGINQAGGWDVVVANAQSLDGYLSMLDVHVPETLTSKSYSPLSIVSTLAWGLGYFGMPHILLRFMAIENPKKIAISRRVASIWAVITMSVGILIGVVGLGMVANNSIAPLVDSETIVINIAELLSKQGAVFAIAAGVIISGILASTMSTADSQLLAASSSASENILGNIIKKNISEKTKMLVARGVLLLISVVGVVIAWDSNSSVFGIVSFAWAGFGAAFGPVMLLALFWKRSNKYGAVAGMIAGGIMVFLWKFVISQTTEVLNVYELLPAFITGLVVNIVVSLCTPKPEKEIIDEFEKVNAMK